LSIPLERSLEETFAAKCFIPNYVKCLGAIDGAAPSASPGPPLKLLVTDGVVVQWKAGCRR
jgi:hypothetical protein